MEMDIAIGLAGAVIGFGGGFIAAALLTASKVADLEGELAEKIVTVRRQLETIAEFRTAERRRERQRKAALAKAQKVNAARNAAKAAQAAQA